MNPNTKTQAEKFKKAAKVLGCGEDEAKFDDIVKKVAQSGGKRVDPKDE